MEILIDMAHDSVSYTNIIFYNKNYKDAFCESFISSNYSNVLENIKKVNKILLI